MLKFLKIIGILLIFFTCALDILFPRRLNTVYFVSANNTRLEIPVDGTTYVYDASAMSASRPKR